MTTNGLPLHFGLDTFGDVWQIDANQTLKNLIEQVTLADKVGVYSFNLGEHHRDDFVISAPDTVLSYMAAKTENIHLDTAVIVLSSDDPVRIYERFSTIQALSGGRAQLTVGRGSFIESFPLFGYSLENYEQLFEEKLGLLHTILNNRPFTWEGELTPSYKDQYLFPPMETPLPVQVAVGGSPQSVVRAAKYDFGLRLAIIGGDPLRFAPFAQLYRNAQEQFGHTTPRTIGIHSPGLVAETDAEAIQAFYDPYVTHNARVGRERGWAPMDEERFMNEVNYGALFVGSVETVAQKIARAIKGIGADTFDLKIGTGSHDAQMRAIELYGTEVIPRVKELLADEA